MSTIKLNFINRSSDTNNNQVVIFQKDASTNQEGTAIARKVIKNCGIGDSHPFEIPGVDQEQKGNVSFKPTIWVGVVSEIEEQQVLNSAIISDINTELSLLGIAAADIVMTGGGSGKSPQPFKFTLENIRFA